MGTNFFTASGIHIGKRSAAGYYCFNCMVRAKTWGEEHLQPFHYICPQCGLIARDKRSPVRHACSFSWAMSPRKFQRTIRFYEPIFDEANRMVYIKWCFNRMLEVNCPIQIEASVGSRFR